jgi:hypothetical protein
MNLSHSLYIIIFLCCIIFKLTWMWAVWCTVPLVTLKHMYFCSPALQNHMSDCMFSYCSTETGLTLKKIHFFISMIQHVENVYNSSPTKLSQAVMLVSCFGRCLEQFWGVEVGVLCAVSVRQILAEYIFGKQNSDWYGSVMLSATWQLKNDNWIFPPR